jgi:hypothetical protein
MRWREFKASDAEAITGMDRETQRVKRRRDQIAPVPPGTHARFNAVLLAEMLLVQEIGAYNIVNNLTLTARSLAAAWVAFWALIETGITTQAAVQLTQRNDAPPPTHMIAHRTDTHWSDTKFTDQPAEAITKDNNPVALVVDLCALGRHLALRAGSLVVENGA